MTYSSSLQDTSGNLTSRADVDDNLRLPKPRTNKDVWDVSRMHGEQLWETLNMAHRCLWSLQTADRTHWGAGHFPAATLPSDITKSGLLRSVNPDACNAIFDEEGYYFGFNNDLTYAYGTYMNVNQKTIINQFFSEEEDRITSKSDEGGEEIVAQRSTVWPDLIFNVWKEKCEQMRVPTSSLQFLFMGELMGQYTTRMFEHIHKHDPNWVARLAWSWGPLRTSIVRCEPGDDNFFAILGVKAGAAVMDMLISHAGELATRDEQTGDILKVKSISNIQFAGRTADLNDERQMPMITEDEPAYGGGFCLVAIDVIITLQDIDPPSDMQISATSTSSGQQQSAEAEAEAEAAEETTIKVGGATPLTPPPSIPQSGGKTSSTTTTTSPRGKTSTHTPIIQKGRSTSTTHTPTTSSPQGISPSTHNKPTSLEETSAPRNTPTSLRGSTSVPLPAPTGRVIAQLPACCGGTRGGGWRSWFCFCGSTSRDSNS